jgi:hypothetical protein
LDELITTGKIVGCSALDVQLTFPQLQTYNSNSSNFSKNFSRRKQDLSLQMGGDGTPLVVAAAATLSGGIPFATNPGAAAAPFKGTAFDGPIFADGVHQFILPGFVDTWFDGRFHRVSAQYHLLSGVPHAFAVEDEGRTLVCRYIMTRNFTEPRHAFGPFRFGNGEARYPGQHVRTISRVLNVKDVANEDDKVVFEMRVRLPFPVDCRFTDKEDPY